MKFESRTLEETSTPTQIERPVMCRPCSSCSLSAYANKHLMQERLVVPLTRKQFLGKLTYKKHVNLTCKWSHFYSTQL